MVRVPLFCLVMLVVSAPVSAAVPWYSSNWTNRVPVTAASALIQGASPFTDFALLVSLDGVRNANVFASANPDGSDLLFTTGDGTTLLERQIVSYDPVAEKAEIWIRVSTFSKTANEFYLYYGNPAANLDPSPAAAWSNDYRAVYHFEDDPGGGVLTDSSPQGSHATLTLASAWTSSDVEDAVIGQGWYFNGSTHHIATNSVSTQDSSYSISAWLAPPFLSTDFFFHAQPGFWHVSSQATSGQAGNADFAGSGVSVKWNPLPIPVNDGYHHYLWSFDAEADTMKFFYDGVPQSIFGFPTAPPHYTGRLINPTNADPVGIIGPMFASVVEDYHDGGADEFRLREGVSSPERILTEYRNQLDNSAFLYFSAEQTFGGTPVGIADAGTLLRLRIFPNPSAGQSSIRYTLPEEGPVRLVVYNVAGREVATLVDRRMPAGTWTDRWNGRSTEGEQLAAGVYFLRLETPRGTKSVKVTFVR